MIGKIRALLCKWLGIVELEKRVAVTEHELRLLNTWIGEQAAITAVAVDAHMHGDSESLVIVCSRLGDGMVKFIPARFGSHRDLREFVKMVEGRFKTRSFYIDGPYPLLREIKRELRY